MGTLKVLWLWLSVTVLVVRTLNLRISPSSLYFNLDGTSTSILFGCLNFKDRKTRIALVQLVAQDEFPFLTDFERVTLSPSQAKSLVLHFFHQPKLHPLVLPFTLYANNCILQLLLEARLEDYNPGSFKISNGRFPKVPCKYWEKLLERFTGKVSAWSREAVEASKSCTRIIPPWEVRHEEWDHSILTFMIETYGKVLPLLDFFYYNRPDRLKYEPSKWMEMTRGFGSFAVDLFDFLKSPNFWKEGYYKILNQVNEVTSKLDNSRKALWHAKLIISLHLITNDDGDDGNVSFTQENSKRAITIVEFLNTHQVRDIPPFLLSKLLTLPLTVEENYYSQSLLKFRDLNRIVSKTIGSAKGSWGWGCKLDYIKRWKDQLRLVSRWVFQGPKCDPCNFFEIERWWGNYNGNLKDILFFNPKEFPLINLESYSGKIISCMDLICFLIEITRMHLEQSVILLATSLTSFGHPITFEFSPTVVAARSLARTMACNLLYRNTVGFNFSWSKSARRFYQGTSIREIDYELSLNPTILVSIILKNATLGLVPISLLSSE